MQTWLFDMHLSSEDFEVQLDPFSGGITNSLNQTYSFIHFFIHSSNLNSHSSQNKMLTIWREDTLELSVTKVANDDSGGETACWLMLISGQFHLNYLANIR